MRLFLVALSILAGLFFAVEQPAHADVPPYGGCGEAWRYPSSDGAGWCRHHGWTIHKHFTIDPVNRLWATDLPKCRTEDSIGCYWNAAKRGNGRGDSFVVSPRGVVYYAAMNWGTGYALFVHR